MCPNKQNCERLLVRAIPTLHRPLPTTDAIIAQTILMIKQSRNANEFQTIFNLNEIPNVINENGIHSERQGLAHQTGA